MPIPLFWSNGSRMPVVVLPLKRKKCEGLQLAMDQIVDQNQTSGPTLTSLSSLDKFVKGFSVVVRMTRPWKCWFVIRPRAAGPDDAARTRSLQAPEGHRTDTILYNVGFNRT